MVLKHNLKQFKSSDIKNRIFKEQSSIQRQRKPNNSSTIDKIFRQQSYPHAGSDGESDNSDSDQDVPHAGTLEIGITPSIFTKTGKPKILADGSNLAYGFNQSLGNKSKVFSAEGLEKSIKDFEDLGSEVKAVVNQEYMRKNKSSNHQIMIRLFNEGKLLLTPSKSYDDIALLEIAAKHGAAIVSNDLFRDFKKADKGVRDVIEQRQIRFVWAFEELYLIKDPYGKNGPKLDDILYGRN